MEGETSVPTTERAPIASATHTAIFLAIAAATVAAGFVAQHRDAAAGGIPASHAHVIPIYASAAALDWLLVLFVWLGIRRRGVRIGSLIAGRWTGARDALRDLALAALFWGGSTAVLGVVEALVGHGTAKSLQVLLPRTPLEIGVWILTSITAGFCEELVFRGYLQRQLLAFAGRLPVAVAGQAVVFAAMHSYQGWRAVVQIAVLGALFGALAAWRRTLRVGMIAHAWQDVWAGWLGLAILR